MLSYSLQQLIESSEFIYLEVNTREYGENSVRRGGWTFEDDPPDSVYDVLIADLIIKNENSMWARYISRIEKAVKATPFPFSKGRFRSRRLAAHDRNCTKGEEWSS